MTAYSPGRTRFLCPGPVKRLDFLCLGMLFLGRLTITSKLREDGPERHRKRSGGES